MTTTTSKAPTRVTRNIFKGSVGKLIEWCDSYAHTAFTFRAQERAA